MPKFLDDIIAVGSSKVGIGTTSPNGVLDIHASLGNWRVNDYGGMYFRNSSNATHESYIHPRSDGSLSIGRVAESNWTGSGTGAFASTTYDHLTFDTSSNATFAGSVISTDGTDTATLSKTGLVLSRSNSYIQSNADNSDTLNIGQSSVRWGNVKVDGATFKVLNGGTERLGISSSGNATFAGSVSIQSDNNDRFLVRSNDYTISRIISRGSSGADLDKGLFSLMSSDGTNNNVEKVRIDSASNSWFNGGNVGIGIVSPSGLLHLHKSGSGTDNTIITEDDARRIYIGRDSIKATDLSNNAALLHIQQNDGDTRFGGDITVDGGVILSAAQKLYLDGGSNSYIHQSASDVIDVVTGGSTRLTVNSNGISSSLSVYSGGSGDFRNYSGTWRGTTGQTGNGFEFINSADGTALTISSTGDITGTASQTGTTSVSQPRMGRQLLAHSTESNNVVIHPYFFNDLANFRKRGGTITYGGLSSNPSDAASDIMFQASALTCSISNSVITGSTWTIELKDFPRDFYYGTRFGISFGSVSFAPSSMLIQYSSDNGANYTTALTSSVRSEYYHTYISNGGTAINAVKFTIGKFNTYGPRVMNIYAYNYDSRGMTEYFLDKAGGTLYGNLTMNSAGFTLDGNTITGIDNDSEHTANDNHIMTSLAIQNKIADNDNNFITASALPTDFVSAANGGTFAGNVAFTGNITANGNINGDGSTNVGNMNNVTAKQLLANGTSLKIGDQQGASITIGKVESEVGGVGQNDATDVVIASNLTVTKKLLIQGELETESTTNTVIKDNVIQLNDGGSSANTKDSGIVIHRGTSQNVAIVWDEDGQTAGGAFRFIATGDTASSADVSMTPQNELGENVIGGASALGFQDVYAAHFRAVGAGNTSGFVGDGSGVTNLNMGNASSGTLAAARGGTGLTSISTLLNSNVTSVSGSSGSCTGNAATATAFSTTLGLTTVSMTFQLAANTWTDTGINSSDLATGTYAMQVYVDDHNAGGGHYDEYYSATISWYGGITNSTNHDEIVLHRAGHASNASHLQVRTLRHGHPGDNLMLQVKQNFAHNTSLNSADGKTMTFKFRRLI